MKQREAFLSGEGDAWFARNPAARGHSDPASDDVIRAILELPVVPHGGPPRLLEIGCGAAMRLARLQQHHGFECHGLDPSAKAVEAARSANIAAHRGTADDLPFADEAFDVVVFGFCLYVCDREDLFRIACEADRVLRKPGWLVTHHFLQPTSRRSGRHRRSRRMGRGSRAAEIA